MKENIHVKTGPLAGFLAVVLMVIFGNLPLQAQSAVDKGQALVNAVDGRAKSSRSVAQMKMILTDNRGGTRERVIRTSRLDDGALEYSLVFFMEPSDVKGVGLLSIDPEKGDADQWLWMPALKKTRRIASSAKDESFMGTDFSFEDMEGRSPAEDTHTWLRDETLDGVPCSVVESVPRGQSSYAKRILWIDPVRRFILRIDFYGKDGSLIKRLLVSDIRREGDYLEAWRMEMTDLVKKRSTLLLMTEWKTEGAPGKEFYTVGNLEKGRMP
jgi:hypothetical protein